MKKLITLTMALAFLAWAQVLAAKQNIPWDTKINTFSCSKQVAKLENFKGKVLLVNFFATYCPPCQVELLEFSDLYRKFNPQGLEILTFMVDQGGERVLPHLIYSKNIKYCVAIANDEILSAFDWPDILPTTFIIDQKGNIVKKYVGYAGKKELEKEILNLLKKN
ncbi:TlpA family protein disulfide reductase [Thermodesulfatator atlanticus]|uniref:TlpA family protein disulfide reductase n=1 Tax=Thermodesulfatator atlanticus TaxID=501497 RepID=UPI0003B35330|nr:TlpA disulfide reductase family protein [Thermodesulfatator atlanticus]